MFNFSWGSKKKKVFSFLSLHIAWKTDPKDICLVNFVDSSCHLPNPDVHTPMAKLEGQGDGWWEDGRQRDGLVVMAVCGRSQECMKGWGWLDQAGRKLEHAWQAASEPLTHLWVWALTEVDTTGRNTVRISNTVTQAGPFEWHYYVFSKVS